MIKSTGSADVSSNIPQERPEGFLPKQPWLQYLKLVLHIWRTRVKKFWCEGSSEQFDPFLAKLSRVPLFFSTAYLQVPSQHTKLQKKIHLIVGILKDCLSWFPCLNVSTTHGPVILIIWISLLVWFQWTHNKLGPIKQMSKHRFTFSLVQPNPPDDVMKISLHLAQPFGRKDHLISTKRSVQVYKWMIQREDNEQQWTLDVLLFHVTGETQKLLKV